MTDFSMKLYGVWAILRWNTFLSLYSSRRLQIINARYKDVKQQVINEIKSSPFFAFQVDESADVALCAQLSYLFLFVTYTT